MRNDSRAHHADAAARHADTHALLAMLAGAALIGSNALMVRYAQVPPTVSAFWRMLLAGVFLCAWVAVRGGWRRLPGRAWLWCLLPAVAFAGDLWLWHRSILLVGPGLATLLGNAQVFFMALAGALLFGERLGPRFLLGLLLAFGGLWLLLGQGWSELPPGYRLGVWLGLATGAAYAVYNVGLRTAQRRARTADGAIPLAQVLALASLGSALVLALAGVAEGVSFAIPGPRQLLALLVLAVFGHGLAWILISGAMQRLPIALIGLLLLLQPLVAFALDVVLLQRVTTPREWLGLAVSLAGIFVAGSKGRRRLGGQPA
jgi:drug/metabolite transporter (DMT)-like permease